ncbi:hypothetical protein DYB36_005284 [Aphanomyces astaci]|uniref:HTH CENPB-type domain-containing protein n=2 Tax=Aphanomyces astaci TaxID=112090 RepID=A0A397A8U4_APHAT|nr:hypothetical protein DYB36_005284 [Aphanomyces astaci]
MSKGMESLDNAPPKPIARVVGRGEPVVGESGKLLLDVPVGSYNIRRSGGNWRKIYWDDLFHTIINTRTSRVIIGYSLVIFLFALCYRYVSVNDPTCNVGITTIMEAYIFSVETIMTIGYGAPSNDIFYGGCGSMAVILTLESFSGIFLDAVCIGMFFVRFSRATTRACSIIFTNFAVIRRIRGDYYFMFQLAEAHVRCYAVRHEVSGEDGCTEEALFQTHHMRIQQPDDDIGAFLLMALPQVVVNPVTNGAHIDFDKFHDLRAAPVDSMNDVPVSGGQIPRSFPMSEASGAKHHDGKPASGIGKKERHRLNDQQRVDIIRAVERDPTLKNVELGRRYNITEAAIRQLLQKKDVILDRYLKSNPTSADDPSKDHRTGNMHSMEDSFMNLHPTLPVQQLSNPISVPPTTSSTGGGGRGGRKGKLRLNDKQRMDIIRAVERDPTLKKVELGRRYNITEAAIRQLLHKKDKIVERVTNGLPSMASTNASKRKPSFASSTTSAVVAAASASSSIGLAGTSSADLAPTSTSDMSSASFDAELYGWIAALQSRNVIVPPTMIQRKAKDLADKYPACDFKPSQAWYSKFASRYHITSSHNHPTAYVTPLDMQLQLKQLRDKILHYSPDRIYNMCETSLFYQLVPSYNILCPFESAEVQQRKMERVSLVVCVNATGTHKVPLLMVGKEKAPLSSVGFKSLPVHYMPQIKAWMDATVFNHWVHQVFLPEVKARTTEPVLLLLEHGAPYHEFNLDNVSAAFVPMNMGSRYQPLNMGIVDALKKEFKNAVFSDLIAVLSLPDSKRLELEQRARSMPKGSAGLQFGRSPHVYDAMLAIKAAWDAVPRTVIQNTWAASTWVPSLDRLGDHKECHIVHDMCAMLSCISVSSTYGEISTEIVEWMAIDDNDSRVLRDEIQREIDDLLHGPPTSLLNDIPMPVEPTLATPWVGDEAFVAMVMAVEDHLTHPRVQTLMGDASVQSSVQSLHGIIRQMRRDALLQKSNNTVELHRIRCHGCYDGSIARTGGNWKQIYWNDLYHTVINVKTPTLISGVVVSYVLVTFVFACLYLVVSYNDAKCNVGIKTLTEAYIFSIETIVHQVDDDGGGLFQTHSMRLQQPDDDLGSYLLMAMPQLVVHRIDQWSPLFPPECRPSSYNATTAPAYPDPLQRAVDHDNGNRDADAPQVVTPVTRTAIERHFEKTNMEVVVILEGEDSTTSNTAQARHSYQLTDIVWDHMFARCVKRHPQTNGVWIDFDMFHDLVPVSSDAAAVVSTSIF